MNIVSAAQFLDNGIEFTPHEHFSLILEFRRQRENIRLRLLELDAILTYSPVTLVTILDRVIDKKLTGG
jgi:hypothetical protein